MWKSGTNVEVTNKEGNCLRPREMAKVALLLLLASPADRPKSERRENRTRTKGTGQLEYGHEYEESACNAQWSAW